MTWLETARRIVENKTADTVDGVLLDLFSASAMVQVHDGLKKPENQARFAAMPVAQAHDITFKILNKGA